MNQHTAIPWHFSQDGTIRSEVSAVKQSSLMADCHGVIIADIQYSVNQHYTEWGQPTSRDYAIPEAQANAEYIIKCVNSHEALIEALQGLVQMLDFEGYKFRPSIEEARVALQKAGEA
jgi:hypothetical protein